MKTICFYYPSRILGGVEVAFCRFAQELSLRGYDVCFIDYKEGYFDDFFKENKKYNINVKYKLDDKNDAIYITTTHNYMKFISFKQRVIYWHVQPWNGVPHFTILKHYISLNVHISRIIKYKDFNIWMKFLYREHNNIFFMDEDTSCILSKFVDLNKKYLPVPILDNKNKKIIFDKNNYNLSWIGRIDTDFKIHILRKVLRDFVKNKIKDKIFYIIGEGAGLIILKKEFYDINNIVFVGTIDNDCLDEFFIKYDIYLNFSMGMSALESASRYIPTICLDFSYKDIKDYYYLFIYQRAGLSLGRMINKNITNGYSFSDVIDELELNFDEISKSCYSYCMDNYSITKVIDKLEDYIKVDNDIHNQE